MNRPKRFIDTAFIDNGLYRRWPPEYKCFWHFINADCDRNGIWEVDLGIVQFTVNNCAENDLSLEKAKEYFKYHIVEIDKGKKWFIPDFIKVQYGNKLNNTSFHCTILKKLLSYNIDLQKFEISYNPPITSSNQQKSYPYKELQDPRWKKKKNIILKRDNFKCVACSHEELLDVHHRFYIEGRKLWEYEDNDLFTLCKWCHSTEHSIIRKRNKYRESVVI